MLRREPPKNRGNTACRVGGLIGFRHGKWEEAAKSLGAVSTPDAEVLHALIVSNLMLGRLSDAIARLEAARIAPSASPELEKDTAAVRYLKVRRDAICGKRGANGAVREGIDCFVCAEYLYSLGRPAAEVQVLLMKALGERDELGEAFGLLGELLIERGQLTKALVVAEKAIKQSPQDARGWYVRGRVRVEREQKEALGDLRKSVELSGELNATMLHWLATALIRERQFDAARNAQMKAAKLRPDDAEIKAQLRQIDDVLSRK